MARRKDVEWSVPDDTVNFEQAQLAVLMDIRDELKSLNRLLNCSNFLDIPNRLKRISANTTTMKRLRENGNPK